MRTVYLLLAIVTFISGLTPVAARVATSELPPLTLAFVRFGSAGALLAITQRWMRLPRPPLRPHLPMLVVLALLCVPINQAGFLFGIKMANASHGGIAYALVPLLVYWISLALGRTKFSVPVLIASILASVGAVIAVMATTHHTSGDAGARYSMFVGDALLLSAAVSWSLFVVLSQPIVQILGALRTLTCVFVLGAIAQLPLVAVDACYGQLAKWSWTDVSWAGIGGLAYLTLCTAYISYLLWYLITARYDVTRSSIVVNSAFLITILAEVWLYDLPLSPWVAVGSAVLFVGVYLVAREPMQNLSGVARR